MDLLLMVAVFIAFAAAAFTGGADSRPSFVDGRIDRIERWFPHSRTD